MGHGSAHRFQGRTAGKWETPASRVLANQCVICRALRVYNMLPHYLFNVADLNPSHKLIAQTLSPGYFHLPTAAIYPKTSREGLRWKLDSLGVSGKLMGRPLEAGATKRTSNTWQNRAQEMRQPHETHLTKLTKHPSPIRDRGKP